MSIDWSDRSDILTVSARRSLQRILELAKEARVSWIVLRRPSGYNWPPYLYAFRPIELKEWAREVDPTLPAEVSLALREDDQSQHIYRRGAANLMSPTGDLRPSFSRVVLTNLEGQPVAVGSAPELTGRGSGEEVITRGGHDDREASVPSAGLPPQPTHKPVTFRGHAPREVGVNDSVELQVVIEPGFTVDLTQPGGTGTGMAQTGVPIEVRLLWDGSGIEADGPTTLRLDPPEPGGVSEGTLRIQGCEVGPVNLVLQFLQNGQMMGALTLSILVVDFVESGGRASARAVAEEPVPHVGLEGMLTVLVGQRKSGNEVFYEYTLSHAGDQAFTEQFRSKPLLDRGGSVARSTIDYVQGLYENVTSKLRPGRGVSDRELKSIGASMCDELMPTDMVRRLWDLRDDIGIVQVTALEPYIPWEMVRLRHPDTGDIDEKFLGEYGLIRLLPGQPSPKELHLQDWSYFRAAYPNGYEKEVGRMEYFTNHLPTQGVDPVELPADYDGFLDSLDAGEFDVLHIACHGRSPHDEIQHAELVIGDRMHEGEPHPVVVDPVTIRDAALRSRRPIVFLNACESGKLGSNLTAWGGWPSSFLAAGAGVFVGTSWPVRDGVASRFAEHFYEALRAGSTLAEAAGAARTATREAGDASWLAYKVYGHPLAQCATQ